MKRASAIKQRTFTLVEVVIVSGLSVILLAIVLPLFVLPTKAWYMNMNMWRVDEETRQLNQEILSCVSHGSIGAGLRSARRATIVPGSATGQAWVDFTVDQNTIPTPNNTGDDQAWRIQWTSGTGMVLVYNNQSKPMLDTDITESATFNMVSDRIMTANVTLQRTLRGKTYSRTITRTIYLINP